MFSDQVMLMLAELIDNFVDDVGDAAFGLAQHRHEQTRKHMQVTCLATAAAA